MSRATIARRVSDGLLDRPFTGVLRIRAAPRTPEQGLLAAVLATAERGRASHRDAAGLHRLDGFVLGAVELSAVRRHRIELPGVIVHHVKELDPVDVTVIDGIPTTGLARTLCDLGSVVSSAAVQRALDDARRRGVSLRWIVETAERLRRPGPSGIGKLLRALEDAERHPNVRGSWFEKLVEDCLRSSELPRLVRQHEVRDSSGRLAGILDLAFPDIRLGVEAHSRQFHFGRAAEHADEDRDLRLSRCGWQVLYVGWQQAQRPEELLEVVLHTARHRHRLPDAT